MHYVGNYSNWINPEWKETALRLTGKQLHEISKQDIVSNAMADSKKIMGNGHTERWLNAYSSEFFDMDINPPWTTGNVFWWIVKMMPGEFLPMHSDPHVGERTDINRYWVPLTDYEDGHVFLYKDTLMKDYESGDVFAYKDANDLHGACNIGFTPRIALQLTEYFVDDGRL